MLKKIANLYFFFLINNIHLKKETITISIPCSLEEKSPQTKTKLQRDTITCTYDVIMKSITLYTNKKNKF